MASKPFSSGHDLAAADVNDLVGVYDRVTAQIDVVSSIAETTIYTKSIGAGHMSTDRMLRFTLIGDYLDNAGTTNITFRIKFGGTTIVAFTTATSIPQDADRQPFELEFKMANLNSASVQFLKGSHTTLTAAAAAGLSSAGIFNQPGDGRVNFATAGTVAINTASAQTLVVTAQHASSDANISLRRHYAMLELL